MNLARRLAKCILIVLTLVILVSAWTFFASASHDFADVPDDSPGPFHGAVNKIKTRMITGGCELGPPPLYCPNNPVTRIQMALFMARLMGVLTPEILHAAGPIGVIPTDAACPTVAHTPPWPQQAIIHSRVTTTAAAGFHEHHSGTTVSTDGGATWLRTDARPFSVDGTAAGIHSNTAYNSTYDLTTGIPVRFGVLVGFSGALPTGSCHLQVEIFHRN